MSASSLRSLAERYLSPWPSISPSDVSLAESWVRRAPALQIPAPREAAPERISPVHGQVRNASQWVGVEQGGYMGG